MADVTIPVDVAKAHAEWLRRVHHHNHQAATFADLLDPKPPTLRDAVVEAGRARFSVFGYADADAVLAVVRERLLGGWQDYADEHAVRYDAPGYFIDTKKVHAYVAQTFDGGAS